MLMDVTVDREVEARQAAPPPFETCGVNGRYHLIRKIGEGGIGEVWLAKDSLVPRRTVAIKVNLPCTAGSRARIRFQREVEVMVLVNHPAIPQVYEMGEIPEGRMVRFWYAMEYIRGLNLHQLVSQCGSIPPRATCEIILELARALGAMHDAGIMHRDVKTENVLLTRTGGVKLLDFGSSRLIKQHEVAAQGNTVMQAQLTTEGKAVVTPAYAPFEQAYNLETQGPKTDFYSLLLAMFICLRGFAAFDQNVWRVGGYKYADDPAFDEMPMILRRIILAGTALNVEDRRFEAAEDLIEALNKALRDLPDDDSPRFWARVRGEAVVGPTIIPDRELFADSDGDSSEAEDHHDVAVPDLGKDPLTVAQSTRRSPRRWPMVLAALALFGVLGMSLVGGSAWWWMHRGVAEEVAAADAPSPELPEARVAVVTPEEAAPPASSLPVQVTSILEPKAPTTAPNAAKVEPPASKPAEPSKSATGTVEVRGDAAEVKLASGSGKIHKVGKVPEGAYTIKVKYAADDEFVDGGKVDVVSGKTYTVRCDAVFKTCSVR